jgi:competence protein ComEA
MASRTRIDDDLSSAELLSRISPRPLPEPPLPGSEPPLGGHGQVAEPWPPATSHDEPLARRSRGAGQTRRSRRAGARAAWLGQIAERTGVAPRAVLGLLLVGAAVASVLLLRLVVLGHRAQAVPLRMTSSSGNTAGTDAPVAPPTTAAPTTAVPAGIPTASAASATTVRVHVVGQVRHPGVVRLPAGARVEQALDAAGGATGKADLVRVNLARPVVDGEQIVVPEPGQPITGAPPAPGAAAGGGTAGGADGGLSPGSPIDLNTASLEQLDALPGVGPVLAQRILDWRSQNGRFSTVDELGEVSGIGEKVLERLRPLVRA